MSQSWSGMGRAALLKALEGKPNDELISYALQSRSVEMRDYIASIAMGGHFSSYHDVVRAATATLNGDQSAQKTWSTADRGRLSALAMVIGSQRIMEDDRHDALTILRASQHVGGVASLTNDDKLLICELLSDLGFFTELRYAVEELDIASIDAYQAALLIANALNPVHGGGERVWLSLLSGVFEQQGLGKVVLDTSGVPVLDRLHGLDLVASVSGPLCTIIMPTHNPGPYIRTAIRSLIQQTWRNLEILVIDDGSDTPFRAKIQDLEGMDPRVQVIRSMENYGSYTQRNLAVSRYAHGDYVTVHDDDDWSHPSRIETQVARLEQRNEIACTCCAARVTDDCLFRRVSGGLSFLRWSYAGLMVKRRAFREIGYWQPLRANADFEFHTRAAAQMGHMPACVGGTAPLLLQRVRVGSLSNGETARGYSSTSRRWHEWLLMRKLERERLSGRRLFPGVGVGSRLPVAPYGLLRPVATRLGLEVDDLVVAHWGEGSPLTATADQRARSLLSEEHSVALLHVDSPLSGAARGVSSQVAELAQSPGVHILSWEDDAYVKTVWVLDPDACALVTSARPRLRVDQVTCPYFESHCEGRGCKFAQRPIL